MTPSASCAAIDQRSKSAKIFFAAALFHIVLLLTYICVSDEKFKNAIWQAMASDKGKAVSTANSNTAVANNQSMSSGGGKSAKRVNSDSALDPECGYLVRKPPDGRLGSQMFAYASFYGMAKKQRPFANKTAFIRVLSQPPYLSAFFENLSLEYRVIPDSWFSKRNFSAKGEPDCCRYYSSFINDLSCDGRHVHVNGFGCSYKYFVDFFAEIRNEFTFRAYIRGKAYHLLDDTLSRNGLHPNNCTTVGVHLRRGDFLADHIFNYGHTPATVEYLQRAVQFYETKILNTASMAKSIKSKCLAFLLFGNEYGWNLKASRQVNLSKPNDTHLILIDPKRSEPAVDMVAMSKCDHVAITTGTFSWWTAFFNRGIVTYQKEYARPNSRHYAEYEPKDYFLPHWIAL